MDAVEVLKKGRALISDPTRWTQHAFARNEQGHECLPHDADAVRWCSVGAAIYAAEGTGLLVGLGMNYLERGFTPWSIAFGNDLWPHEEMLAAWDRAIALAEEDTAGAPLPPIETPKSTETVLV